MLPFGFWLAGGWAGNWAGGWDDATFGRRRAWEWEWPGVAIEDISAADRAGDGWLDFHICVRACGMPGRAAHSALADSLAGIDAQWTNGRRDEPGEILQSWDPRLSERRGTATGQAQPNPSGRRLLRAGRPEPIVHYAPYAILQ